MGREGIQSASPVLDHHPCLLAGVVALVILPLTSHGYCFDGPTEMWEDKWSNVSVSDKETCVPLWIAHLPDAPQVVVMGQCGTGHQFYRVIDETSNKTIAQSSFPTGAGLYSTGIISADSFVYLGGVSVLSKLNISTGSPVWSVNQTDVPSGCKNPAMKNRQKLLLDRGLILSIGYCDQDAVLFLEVVNTTSGYVVKEYSWDVSFWPWTGQVGHRCTMAFHNDLLHIATQSESAGFGWLVQTEWTGITAGKWPSLVPRWNRSLALPEGLPIQKRIHLEAAHMGGFPVEDMLVVLFNSGLEIRNLTTGHVEDRISLEHGVSKNWALTKLPPRPGLAPEGDTIVVTYNTESVHPIQRVFTATFTMYKASDGSGTLLPHLRAEVPTVADMELEEITASYFHSAKGAGLYIASYTSCPSINPCLDPNATLPPTAVVVAYNLSEISPCMACSKNWAGKDCSKKCVCYSGGGSTGACYDGPWFEGGCRCNTHTYKSYCLPCMCANGACDGGDSGSGNCLYCTDDTWFGPNCAKQCKCAPGELCDSGVRGSGRCISHHTSPKSTWEKTTTIVLIAVVGAVTVVAIAVFIMCKCGVFDRKYQPVITNDDIGNAED